MGLDSYKWRTLSFADILNKPQYWLIILPMLGRDGLYVQTKGIISWISEDLDSKALSTVKDDAFWIASDNISAG